MQYVLNPQCHPVVTAMCQLMHYQVTLQSVLTQPLNAAGMDPTQIIAGCLASKTQDMWPSHACPSTIPAACQQQVQPS